MTIAALLLLTVCIVVAILVKKRKKKLTLKNIRFRQSLMHEAIKQFLPDEIFKRDYMTQSKKRKEDNTFRFIRTSDQKVYWVKNNTFYYADIVDGEFEISDGKPINTENLSKKDIDMLLYILDALESGKL
jgi:hypothetical protein